jgi:hypothetical protein
MGKNKDKKLAKRAAANATAAKSQPPPTPAPRSSTNADGGEATEISVPYSSEGPTLPVIGDPGALTNGGAEQEDNGGVRKRRKTDNASVATKTRAEGVVQATGGNDTAEERKRKGNGQEMQGGRPRKDLAELYEPWNLLPADLRVSVEKRVKSWSWEDRVAVVVFTRNQNIKSGINRLRELLTTPAETTDESPTDSNQPDTSREEKVAGNDIRDMVAITAQGEATTKLVGIVEMTKRNLKPTSSEPEPKAEKPDVQKWYSYIGLTSCVIDTRTTKTKDKGKRQKDDKDEEEEAFESILDIQEKEEEARKAKRTVPVLTVWMARNRIPEFAHAFGENIFQVVMTKEE